MKKYDYIINNKTFAILPYSNGRSRILEGSNEFIFDESPKQIINKNCLLNGSSYSCRREITEKLTGDTYKAPMLLNNINGIILFPTESPRLQSCCWINYKNIKSYYKLDKKKVLIKFYDGKSITVLSSLNVIKNQILRSNFLNYRLRCV